MDKMYHNINVPTKLYESVLMNLIDKGYQCTTMGMDNGVWNIMASKADDTKANGSTDADYMSAPIINPPSS